MNITLLSVLDEDPDKAISLFALARVLYGPKPSEFEIALLEAACLALRDQLELRLDGPPTPRIWHKRVYELLLAEQEENA